MEGTGADDGIILRWIFRKRRGRGMDWIGLAKVAGTCEWGNEL